MDTIMMHSTVLFRLFEALSSDFVTNAALKRKELAYGNMSDAKLDHYLFDYDRKVDTLIESISEVLGNPDEVSKLFGGAGIDLQLSVLMRHEYICDMLQKEYKTEIFIVPSKVDELFKRLYIEGYRSFQPFLKR